MEEEHRATLLPDAWEGMMACDHPLSQRWQYRVMWLCCCCYRHFWGDKRATPNVDIYGRPA